MINFPKTQHLIEELVTSRIVPGVNYALIKENQTFTSTIGFASTFPAKSQLSPFAIYDLASLTKVLGTTNIMLELYQQGRLNFTEPLADFIPSFKGTNIRLFNLLTHTSGIRGWIPNRDQLTGPELLTAIDHLPVTDDLNQKMKYADTNFILLGQVIKQLYHAPVQTVIQKRLLAQMPLKATSFNPNPALCVPTALVSGRLLKGQVHDPKARQLGADCGSAGLFANLGDLIKFAQGYLGIRQHFLPLDQEIIADLFDIKSRGGVHPRSWGWDLCFDPRYHFPIIFHTGFTGTLMLLDRVRQSGLILLSNRIHPSGHNQAFLAMRTVIINSFLKENSQE
jgi:CubicO group peptidase (beta-lactamase class C family)